MTFSAAFRKTFPGAFGDSTAVSVAATWYGVGAWHASAPYPAEAAILAANVVAAYQPHWGAADNYSWIGYQYPGWGSATPFTSEMDSKTLWGELTK